jgi:transposase
VCCIDADYSTATRSNAAILSLAVDQGVIMSEPLQSTVIMGADISSTEIVIACANTNHPVKTIANNHKAIETWLKKLPKETVIGMEATGRYHNTLADCAAGRGHRVYVINPKYLALYAKGVGQRGKTDPLDANVIARYVAREGDQLRPYTVPTTTQRTLRQLLSQRAGVVKHCAAIDQCLRATASSGSEALNRARQHALQSLQALITEIDAELKEVVKRDAALEAKRVLLQTIDGVGPLNSLAHASF